MIDCQRCCGRRKADVDSRLNAQRRLRLSRWIRLRSDGHRDRIRIWRCHRCRVRRRIRDRIPSHRLRSDHAQSPAGGSAAAWAAERPRQHIAWIRSRHRRHGRHYRRRCPRRHSGWRYKLQRKSASDSHSRRNLLRRIGHALRRKRHARRRRKNLRCHVTPVRAYSTAPARACCAGHAPSHGRIRMPGARCHRLECLRRAQFHARGIRRQRQRDVAQNRFRSRARFRRVRLARCRDLHGRRRRQIRGRRVHSARRDSSGRSASACYAIHTPTHAGVRAVGHGGGKRRLISEQYRSARWRDTHFNGRRRWRREYYRACASSAAAQRPHSRREESGHTNSGRPGFLTLVLQKGLHTLRKAGEGPANKNGTCQRLTFTPGNAHGKKSH